MRWRDGWMVVAGTGRVYCRPSCVDAGTNTVFRVAAAAQVSGLRACPRCLPDEAPGSPEWNLRTDLAARAVRLVEDGVADGLAGRLGVSERHLGEVLAAELGAEPAALVRARRARTARLLVAATGLAASEVAFAAGFEDARRLDETLTAIYGANATAWRNAGEPAARAVAERHAGGTADPETGGMSGAAGPDSGGAAWRRVALRLPVREPVDGAGLIAFLGNRAVPGVEHVSDGRYGRTLALPHGPATVWLEVGEACVEVVLRLAGVRDLGTAVNRVRRLVDADADPAEVDAVLGADPALAPLVRHTPGIRVPGAVDGPELALKAVFGQQISVAAARTAAGRLTERLGAELPVTDGPLTRLFPTPAAIVEHGAELLTGPRRRVATILTLCAAMAGGDLEVHAGRDPDELSRELRALPGIGPWTAGYVAMRVLGATDVLLTTDLMVRRGAEVLGLLNKPSTPNKLNKPDELDAYAKARWSPWRSYAGMHLWRASNTARLPRGAAG